MVRQRTVTRITFTLGSVEREIFFVVLIMRPLRRGIMNRGVEIIVARGNVFTGIFGGACFGFTAARGGFKRGRNIGIFFHALTDAGKIGVSLGAARRVVADRARLIPIHAHRADGVVEQPALLGPAACDDAGVHVVHKDINCKYLFLNDIFIKTIGRHSPDASLAMIVDNVADFM